MRTLLRGILAMSVFGALVSGRAVNISNTWTLPEEGFPVFYRHFRDRISWYEADAVCQFHHANLVTADSTLQYDAIRAYLKELDITENVWLGLSKPAEKPNFTWTDFKGLSGEGHWQEAIPEGDSALCVAIDPSVDFLWKPLVCGGPEVASFICELPVPSWAMGPRGCLLTELPSLTVLYIPEQLALELTSDCGLDGTKRIACKGNADREDILRQLTCAISHEDYDSDKSSKSTTTPTDDLSSEENIASSKTTKPWIWTSNTIDGELNGPSSTTRHRRASTQQSQMAENPTKSSQIISSTMGRSRTEGGTSVDLSSTSESYELTSSGDAVEATGQVDEQTTTESGAVNEEQVEMLSDAVTEQSRAGVEDTAEYPGAIGQGQLFSFIDNGTMFDIIDLNLELNETVAESDKKTTSSTETSTITADTLYTTVVYHKEPPVKDANFVTNKSIKKAGNFPQKKSYSAKIKNDKSMMLTTTNKPPLTKEVEIYSIVGGESLKEEHLNRTFRKQLPSGAINSQIDEKLKVKTLNFTSGNQLDEGHQHVEIRLNGENMTERTLFITTKRIRSEIDPNIEILNRKNQTKESSDSEPIFTKIRKADSFQNKEEEEIETSSRPIEPEPQAQPRPNRQRQLTRPQRRSFYPYFFSRVLG